MTLIYSFFFFFVILWLRLPRRPSIHASQFHPDPSLWTCWQRFAPPLFPPRITVNPIVCMMVSLSHVFEGRQFRLRLVAVVELHRAPQ